jgi:hypothetical protein
VIEPLTPPLLVDEPQPVTSVTSGMSSKKLIRLKGDDDMMDLLLEQGMSEHSSVRDTSMDHAVPL